MPQYTIPVWKMIVESVKKADQMERFLTIKEIIRLVHTYYQQENVNDKTIRLQTIFHCINHPSRIHSPGKQWESNPLFLTDEVGGFRLLKDEEKKKKIEAHIDVNAEEQEEDSLQFALESMLEEYIFRNWNNIDFGEPLELYQGENGRQFKTDVGIIDFLCRNKTNGDFVVIELKKGRKSDEVVGQILRYIGWIKKNIAKENNNVRGIIITGEDDEKMDFAVSSCSFLTSKQYKIRFTFNT